MLHLIIELTCKIKVHSLMYYNLTISLFDVRSPTLFTYYLYTLVDTSVYLPLITS